MSKSGKKEVVYIVLLLLTLCIIVFCDGMTRNIAIGLLVTLFLVDTVILNYIFREKDDKKKRG
ncbi:hypothetical protein [Staphylococcus pettenkoferi]|uniref:Mobilization protein n=1 Tax=Staphylococcus pettenkoferi TaxID=170573 RepID=A0ABT4BQI0_9STAP|nr:hypothetical protein [Staphylococcus pettenkoferi]HDZ5690718.1 hypothetical protein [Staphylococcus aureus]MCY1576682.1 hypothetical protein [Staphylococcus pettenkoferi]MCY1584007.1 hypothetical protein [Staphylococcus pettenkoferi]MCY1593583.1 hypothetical protein [Staphylococcus pettenkoferi]MCY1610368.1 hypothetical protein [Staphylococcus pettenkoferi]